MSTTTSKTRSGIIPSNNTKKGSSNNKVIPGEDVFLRVIDLAEYEINIDPYRGIQPLIAQQQHRNQARKEITGNIDSVPKCSTSDSENDNEHDNHQIPDFNAEDSVGWWRLNCAMRQIESDLPSSQTSADSSVITEIMTCADYSQRQVQAITGSTCPTLVKWITCAIQNQQKRNAKRKRKRATNSTPTLVGCFGRRYSEDSKALCICDFNPFCMGTLGGAMDEMLENWLKERSCFEEVDCDNDGDNPVIVIDDANESNITNKSLTTPTDLMLQNDLYVPKTLERLKRVRKFIEVDEESIRVYLKKILSSLSEVLSLDEGVNRVKQLHESLIFTVPLRMKNGSGTLSDSNDATTREQVPMQLSMPPGIENLGATCYLNTQLQCLAQNLVFVDGIMSWRPSTENGDSDRMTSIMAQFQDLLLQMKHGPYSTVNTLEFSNALGLDHFEQQDPNEFSRLFLERMHVSFQDSGNNKNLADLLPRLFQGVMVYETTCLVCNTKSKRTEEFMDLNLPIVQHKSAQPGVQRTIESFCKTIDSDVQFCLNQYCREEMLEGENRYHCSHCGKKCDARRAVAFQTLPPILNVQVSFQIRLMLMEI
jgi:hypothetical protein